MGPFLLGAVRLLLAAQAAEATLAGSVRDDVTGKALANAVVALPDLNRLAVTGADGRYALSQVPPGPQHITVRYLGYAPRTLHALVPRVGKLEINVSLHPDPLRLPGIEVRPQVIVRGLEPMSGLASPDRAASLTAVRNHPLLAEPDVFQALSGGEVGLRPESPTGVHIRGGAADQTGYLLDGIPVLSPYHAAALFSAWNPDALAQVELWSTASSPAYPDALSGTIAAATRAPGSRLQLQGGATTTQTRLTVDGPAGSGGAGYLLSLRSAYPGLLASKDEASYLGGESGDWLAKLEAPLWRGRIRLLGYGSGNEITSAARATAGDVPGENPRNSFEWTSRSLGVEWSRVVRRYSMRLTGWTASGDAKSTWTAEAGRAGLGWSRRDQGLLAAVDHSSAGSFSTLGVRFHRSETTYQVASDSAPDLSLDARTPLAAGFLQHVRSLRRFILTLGASLAETDGTFYSSPAVQLRWQPTARVGVSGSLGRSHQFAQSLRNPESVVGSVFPVDLYLGAGAPGIPVARNDQVTIAADYRPAAGMRLGLQAYQRALHG
ncbi:MAG TPA: TonB-dependent receptor, partial [Gemmatimonadales bacterium]